MNTFILGTERYCWFLHVVYVSCHFTGFITSCWVLVGPSGFSMRPQIMWPTNRHLLVFLSGYHTFSLPRLVAPAMTSTRTSESTETDISAPDLWEKAYDSFLCMLIVGLSSVVFIVLRFISHTFWGFIEKRSWILSNVFFCLTWQHGFCPPNCQCDASYLLVCICSTVPVSQG